jgi:hypothetical protein
MVSHKGEFYLERFLMRQHCTEQLILIIIFISSCYLLSYVLCDLTVNTWWNWTYGVWVYQCMNYDDHLLTYYYWLVIVNVKIVKCKCLWEECRDLWSDWREWDEFSEVSKGMWCRCYSPQDWVSMRSSQDTVATRWSADAVVTRHGRHKIMMPTMRSSQD